MSWQIQQDVVVCPDCKEKTTPYCLGVKSTPPKNVDASPDRDTIQTIWNNVFEMKPCDVDVANQLFERRKSGDGAYFYYTTLKGEEVGIHVQPNETVEIAGMGCWNIRHHHVQNPRKIEVKPCLRTSYQTFRAVETNGTKKRTEPRNERNQEADFPAWAWVLIGGAVFVCIAILLII